MNLERTDMVTPTGTAELDAITARAAAAFPIWRASDAATRAGWRGLKAG